MDAIRETEKAILSPLDFSALETLIDILDVGLFTIDRFRRIILWNKFRGDLYYRIKVFTIQLPSLRKRTNDIPLLVEYFVKRFNREAGRNITGVSESVMRVLNEHPWPGNVRELEHAIEHAFVVCTSNEIELFDLPPDVTWPKASVLSQAAAPPKQGRKKISREELVALLDLCEWNKSEVARRLNCSHTAVWQHMKKWDIPLRKE